MAVPGWQCCQISRMASQGLCPYPCILKPCTLVARRLLCLPVQKLPRPEGPTYTGRAGVNLFMHTSRCENERCRPVLHATVTTDTQPTPLHCSLCWEGPLRRLGATYNRGKIPFGMVQKLEYFSIKGKICVHTNLEGPRRLEIIPTRCRMTTHLHQRLISKPFVISIKFMGLQKASWSPGCQESSP